MRSARNAQKSPKRIDFYSIIYEFGRLVVDVSLWREKEVMSLRERAGKTGFATVLFIFNIIKL